MSFGGLFVLGVNPNPRKETAIRDSFHLSRSWASPCDFGPARSRSSVTYCSTVRHSPRYGVSFVLCGCPVTAQSLGAPLHSPLQPFLGGRRFQCEPSWSARTAPFGSPGHKRRDGPRAHCSRRVSRSLGRRSPGALHLLGLPIRSGETVLGRTAPVETPVHRLNRSFGKGVPC